MAYISLLHSLLDISMIMGDGVMFLSLRFQFEKWAEEANTGNKDSATLIEIVNHFERLIKVVTRRQQPLP